MEINITKINLNPNAGGGGGNSGGGNSEFSQYINKKKIDEYLFHFSDYWFDGFNGGSNILTTYGVDKCMIIVENGWANYYFNNGNNSYEYMYNNSGEQFYTPYISSDIVALAVANNVCYEYSYNKFVDENTIIGYYDTTEQYQYTDILNENTYSLQCVKQIEGNDIVPKSLANGNTITYDIVNPASNDIYNTVYLPITPKGYIRLVGDAQGINEIDWTKYKGCSLETLHLCKDIDGKLHIKNFAHSVAIYPTDFCLFDSKPLEEYEWVFSDTAVPKIFYKNIGYLKRITIANDNIDSLEGLFSDCKQLKVINGFKWDSSKELKYMNSLCYFCETLIKFDGSGLSTSAVTSMYNVFMGCNNLKELDISGWDFSSLKQCSDLLPSSIERLKFGKNMKLNLSTYTSQLPVEDVMGIIDGLFDFVSAGEIPNTLTQGKLKIPNYIGKLTDEQIAKGTSKGWTITN